MTKMEFWFHRQRKLEAAWKENPMSPGQKAARTRELLKKAQKLPYAVKLTIASGFDPEVTRDLNPAHKAHFTMGTYTRYLRLRRPLRKQLGL